MKIFITTLLTFFSFIVSAQTPAAPKVWVSDDRLLYLNTFVDYNNDPVLCIETMDPERYYNFRGHVLTARVSSWYTLKTDTLTLKKGDSDGAKFLLDTIKKGVFILNPLDDDARKFMDRIAPGRSADKIRFHDIALDHTDTIKFEKILFHSTTCYGRCIPMSIRIDNNRKVKYISETNDRLQSILKYRGMQEDEKLKALEGCFTGKLSPALYDRLIKILKMSDLDKLRANTATNIDAPTYSMEIWYNHKVWAISSMTMPLAIDELLQYLLDLPQNIKLERATNDFDIPFTVKPELGKDRSAEIKPKK